MSRELITDWSNYQAAIDRLLVLSHQKIMIYDEDLLSLRLGESARLNWLKQWLSVAQPNSIRIAVRNAEPLRRQQSHLLQLFAVYAHIVTVHETGEELGALRDAMILVGNKHGLIRFDREQARSKLLVDEPDSLGPYLQRFEEIWEIPGNVVGATNLGL